MPDEDGSWFARWEEDLPSPEELMPLSQTLITPDLALAFDIHPPPPPHHPPPPDFVDDLPDEPARTLKRPRLVWTPQLHKRFVDAVAHLGIKNAVPKTIMQLMSVDGLTRENVASHLQKYRLYLKRMQGLSSSAVASGPVSAEDQLFASAPFPHPYPGNYFQRPVVPDHFIAMQNRQNMAAAQQQQFFHQRQIGQFLAAPVAGFEGFLARPGMQRGSQMEEMEAGATRVLTLFPTGDN